MGGSRGGNNRQNTPARDPWLRRQLQQMGGAGKGDRARSVDKGKFDAEYDRIFGKCSVHPDYKATEAPTCDCVVCRRLWREKQLRSDNASSV